MSVFLEGKGIEMLEMKKVNYKGDSQMEKGSGKARGRKDPEKEAKWGIGRVQLQRRH